jgi:hypothetical protein
MTVKQELIRNPDREFRSPVELLRRNDLSSEEKLFVLQNWQADLVELQTATEENMSRSGGESGSTADKLMQVAAAITRLEDQVSQDR